ncbi:hypothetical protein PR048_001334 [Dryococelus australis]|uniref:Uncharacterized protein n=1 Tax=Dryococelus australis TaxID=614101 RepID=A0ABQ9IH35_9NEOP|nr:hypothetical protein PR048_001334 [Dryococelus australis]
MLLGAEVFMNFLCIGQLKPAESELTFQKTTFGRVASGRVTSSNTGPLYTCHPITNEDLHKTSGIWEHASPNLTSHRMKYYVKLITQRLLDEMTKDVTSSSYH